MSSTVKSQSRGRGRPRNPIVAVSFGLASTATKRDSKQLQVKANKLGGHVIKRTESEMVVHFSHKGAGGAASNFERSVKSVPFTSAVSRKALDPYSV
jgi:hypothetical protein